MENNTTQTISTSKSEQLRKRGKKGLNCLLIGAFLGFISCVLSIINPVPDLYYHILYGLTSVAITVIFVGLYCIFE